MVITRYKSTASAMMLPGKLVPEAVVIKFMWVGDGRQITWNPAW